MCVFRLAVKKHLWLKAHKPLVLSLEVNFGFGGQVTKALGPTADGTEFCWYLPVTVFIVWESPRTRTESNGIGTPIESAASLYIQFTCCCRIRALSAWWHSYRVPNDWSHYPFDVLFWETCQRYRSHPTEATSFSGQFLESLLTCSKPKYSNGHLCGVFCCTKHCSVSRPLCLPPSRVLIKFKQSVIDYSLLATVSS